MNFDASGSSVSRQNFRQARIFVIQNNPDLSSPIEQHLKCYLPEVELVQAHNREQAMTLLNACTTDEEKLPKLVVMDLFMPRREDGWLLLERVKSLPSPGSQVPVILLSPSTEADDVREAYERGASSYLVKPSTADEWPAFMKMFRLYWWETVLLPANYRF